MEFNILFSVFKRQVSTIGHAFQRILRLSTRPFKGPFKDDLKFTITVKFLGEKKKDYKGMVKWYHLGKWKKAENKELVGPNY